MVEIGPVLYGGTLLKAKSTNKKVAIVAHYFFCWNIIFMARYEVVPYFWGKGSAKVNIHP